MLHWNHLSAPQAAATISDNKSKSQAFLQLINEGLNINKGALYTEIQYYKPIRYNILYFIWHACNLIIIQDAFLLILITSNGTLLAIKHAQKIIMAILCMMTNWHNLNVLIFPLNCTVNTHAFKIMLYDLKTSMVIGLFCSTLKERFERNSELLP